MLAIYYLLSVLVLLVGWCLVGIYEKDKSNRVLGNIGVTLGAIIIMAIGALFFNLK